MNIFRIRHHTLSLAIAMLCFTNSAGAAPPDFNITLEAGLACDFALSLDGWNGKGHFQEFKDKNGFIRSISAGTGAALRFTNIETGKTFSTKSNGAVSHTTTYSLDGSYVVSSTGHNVLILFPTDIPAGPSTTLYVGKIVYSSDVNNNFTLQKASNSKTDICAILSSQSQ